MHVSDVSRCQKKALDYLAIRSRSIFEMKVYLTRKGFSRENTDQVIDRLKELGYLNDLEFARSYIRYRTGMKVIGEKMLLLELRKKGISSEVAKSALCEEDFQENEDRLFELAQSKYETVKEKKDPFTRVFAFLAQRGFKGQIVYSVVNRLKNQHNA